MTTGIAPPTDGTAAMDAPAHLPPRQPTRWTRREVPVPPPRLSAPTLARFAEAIETSSEAA
jgi:hypothetical protein